MSHISCGFPELKRLQHRTRFGLMQDRVPTLNRAGARQARGARDMQKPPPKSSIGVSRVVQGEVSRSGSNAYSSYPP